MASDYKYSSSSIQNDGKEDIFPSNKIVFTKFNVKTSSQLTKYTLEDGTIVADNKIENQTEVNVKLGICDVEYLQIYKRIEDARVKGTEFVIATNGGYYQNMYLVECSYEVNSKRLYGIEANLRFIEQQFTKVKTDQITNKDTQFPDFVDGMNGDGGQNSDKPFDW